MNASESRDHTLRNSAVSQVSYGRRFSIYEDSQLINLEVVQMHL